MRWLIALLVLAITAVVSISFYLQPNDFSNCTNQPGTNATCEKADAIVVVSGGDTAARTDAGIQLYKNGWANYLILSGAAMDKSGPSNAAAMKLQAVGVGVPEAAVLIDEEALNTKQNATNTQSIFKDKNFKNVILVTSGYHQRRASLEFNKRSDGIIIRNHPVTTDNSWGWFWWASPRGWWLAGGELVKIAAFYMGASE